MQQIPGYVDMTYHNIIKTSAARYYQDDWSLVDTYDNNGYKEEFAPIFFNGKEEFPQFFKTVGEYYLKGKESEFPFYFDIVRYDREMRYSSYTDSNITDLNLRNDFIKCLEIIDVDNLNTKLILKRSYVFDRVRDMYHGLYWGQRVYVKDHTDLVKLKLAF